MIDPVAATEIASMTDKQFFILLATAIAVLQFLYRIWDKNDTKLVLAAIQESQATTLEAINQTLKTFAPHLERSRKIYGIVKDLKGMHDIRDDDGRFIWYMPREIIETQRELTQLTHTVATTQKHMAKILERQEVLMQTGHEEIRKLLSEHQESCKNQYHALRDNLKD